VGARFLQFAQMLAILGGTPRHRPIRLEETSMSNPQKHTGHANVAVSNSKPQWPWKTALNAIARIAIEKV
jgi:hypothetical protein